IERSRYAPNRWSTSGRWHSSCSRTTAVGHASVHSGHPREKVRQLHRHGRCSRCWSHCRGIHSPALRVATALRASSNLSRRPMLSSCEHETDWVTVDLAALGGVTVAVTQGTKITAVEAMDPSGDV